VARSIVGNNRRVGILHIAQHDRAIAITTPESAGTLNENERGALTGLMALFTEIDQLVAIQDSLHGANCWVLQARMHAS